jgi:hypothetical protein
VTLDEEARDRLLAWWEREVVKFSSALTGPSVTGVDEPGGLGNRFLIGPLNGFGKIYSG